MICVIIVGETSQLNKSKSVWDAVVFYIVPGNVKLLIIQGTRIIVNVYRRW